MHNKTLLILCFLGDPALPAVSVPNTGGYNVDIKELLDFLAGTDWNCVVITNTSIYLKEHDTTWSTNIQIYRIPIEDTHINQQEYLQTIFPRIVEDVKELCQKYAIRPSLIHSHYWFSGYLAKRLSEHMGVPFVHSAVSLSMDKINSGIPPRSHIQTNWENEFLPAAKAVFVITTQERELLLQYYPVRAERVLVVGRSVPEEFRRPQHDAEGFPVQLTIPDQQRLRVASSAIPASTLWWNSGAYLFMGRLREIKGIDIIIRAWFRLYKIYGDCTAPLWVVGGTPDAIAALREQFSQELDLARAEERYKLVWWGYLSPAGMSTLMLKSAVLLMHSRFEAGGRIILEAMSSRRPVIATPTGFAKDYIQDWVNGFLVEYGDTDALAQRMELFLCQPLLSNAMGNNAYQTFLQMEKQWDCYGRHARVYRLIATCPDRPLPQDLIALREFGTITDFVKKGLLTAYPYCLPDTGHLETQICRITEGSLVALNSNENSNQWKVCYAGKACVVTQYYSAMNELAFWAGEKIPKVLLAADRYMRADLSCNIPGIVPAIKTVQEHFLLLTPEREHFLPSASDYDNIHNILKQINISPFRREIPQTPLGAPKEFAILSSRWSEIRNTVDGGLCPDWTAFWAKNGPSLAAHWKLAEANTPRYCRVYGDSAWQHLCVDAGKEISLYPSDKLYWGEQGYDQARLWLEYEWFCGKIPCADTQVRYQLALSCAGISEKLFRSWCLCLLCQGIQRGFHLKTGEEQRLIGYLDYLLTE